MLIFTYREEFEEWVLENLPLFVLVGNHWDVDFAEVLREQEDETDGAEEKRKAAVKPPFLLRRGDQKWTFQRSLQVCAPGQVSVGTR